jgi:hypothetical protein
MANGFIDHKHDSEKQEITAPPIISAIHKSLLHPTSFFPAYCVMSRSLTTAANSGDSLVSRAYVLSSQPPVHNSTDN